MLVAGYTRFGTQEAPGGSYCLSVEFMRDEFADCFNFDDGQVFSKVRVLGLRVPIVLPPVDLRLDMVDRASVADGGS